MEFYRKYWSFFGGLIFVGLSFFLIFEQDMISHLQVILICSWMTFLIHQFEEYAVPGGFPSLGNITFGEKKEFDRYPLNANMALINNVFLAYPFYIIPIFFPNQIWLGLIQVGQAMAQILNHGIWNNIKLKTAYNPGLAAVILLNWPIGIYYIWYVHSNNLATTADYIVGFIGSLLSLVVLWGGPVKLLRDRNTKYVFSDVMLYGFNHHAKKKVEDLTEHRGRPVQ